MTCIRIERGFICGSPSYRLPLVDGRRVFMSWHRYCGPMFFLDRYENREIVDWYEDKLICDALNWFLDRGQKA